MNILNYYQATDHIASSGQPTEQQFRDIAAQGYTTVINLAMPKHETSISDEGDVVTALGMTYIHIPVPFDAPTEDHLKRFSAFMDSLSDTKVWVHCVVNARVSAFLYRYLQEARSASPDEASTPILRAWLPEMDDVWKAFTRLT